MITRTNKQDALARLNELKARMSGEPTKDSLSEWLSPEKVGYVMGYTRSWAWEKMRSYATGKNKNGIPARRDPSRGGNKPYYVAHVHDLERYIEDIWPEPHVR